MSCQTKDCPQKGEWSIVINIPATGFSTEAAPPLSVILDLALCRDHAEDADVEEFLTPEFRARIMANMAGRVPPDFDRAWPEAIRHSSRSFETFRRAQQRQNQ